MTDESVPENIVEDRELWSIQIRSGDASRWIDHGTDKADAGEVLRTYDFWREKNTDFQVRLIHTDVLRKVADAEELRKRLAESEQPAE